MRCLIIDPFGDALDLGMRARAAGHQVRYFVRDEDATREIGAGLLDVTRDFQAEFKWADLIFCADNGLYQREISSQRQLYPGKPIVGHNPEVREWEINRTLGQDILKRAGVDVAPYKEFSDYDHAIKYVKSRNTRLVCKPCSDEDKSLSYVSTGPADLVWMLERWKKRQPLKGTFIIQDFVAGEEISAGGYFGPSGFIEGLWVDAEDKRLMSGGRGPNTGSMGAITVFQTKQRNSLARQVLLPLEDRLAEAGYVGSIDVSVIINEDGEPIPLEFTCRPGYPSLQIEAELREGDPLDWLVDLCEGHDPKNAILDTVACGVMLKILASADKAMTHADEIGVPVYGLTDRLWRHFHPYHLMAGEAPVDAEQGPSTAIMPCSAGRYVGVVTGTGDTVSAARRAAYKRVSQIKIPLSMVYRDDIGERLKGDLVDLHRHGYAIGLDYA